MASRDLRNAVTVITGATSGIGRATALAFAEQGAHLVLAARDANAIDEVVRECELRGGRAIAVPADVVDPAALPAVVQAAIALGGGIDIWVNNAGTGAVGAFDETPMKAHEQVVQIDLLGYMRGAHAVVPEFKKQGHGVLINLQSLGSWVPQPYSAAYSAAKFGLRGFSEALRGELSHFPDVHVCDVFPSFVDTPGISHGANYSGSGVRPIPPMLDPREVAAAVVALAKNPQDSLILGLQARLLRAAHALMPGYSRMVARVVERAMKHASPTPRTDGALYQPPPGPRSIDGGWRDHSLLDTLNRSKTLRVAATLGMSAIVLAAQRSPWGQVALFLGRRLGAARP